MRLFPQELAIEDNEGFAPDKDIFKRKEFADQLTKVVRALEGPAVLVLDAPWGAGKTTFIKMWRGELTNLRVPNIYFDSFANDYHEDAFLSLAAEVVAKAQNLKPKNKRALNDFKKNAIKVAKILGRASLRVGIRIATVGVLSGGELEEGVKAVSETAASIGDEAAKLTDEIGALIKERLESHHADKGAFEKFAGSLLTLANSLSESEESEPTKNQARPLIFIIDELDRCRPTFALELLEKIKHFFAVDGIIFVLVTNLKQLESSVRVTYGDIDARRYLEKFYHLRFSLPTRVGGNSHVPTVSVYTRFILGNVIKPGRQLQDLEQFLRAAAEHNEISLRTLERILTYIGIVLASTGADHLVPMPLVTGLCMLKVLAPSLYSDAASSHLTYESVERFFKFADWREGHDPNKQSRLSEFASDWWKYTLGGDLPPDTRQRFDQGLWRYNFQQPSDIIRYLCELIDGMSFPGVA